MTEAETVLPSRVKGCLCFPSSCDCDPFPKRGTFFRSVSWRQNIRNNLESVQHRYCQRLEALFNFVQNPRIVDLTVSFQTKRSDTLLCKVNTNIRM